MSIPQQPSRIAPNPNFKHSINEILRIRELGLKSYIGCDDDLYAKLYSKMESYSLKYKHNPGNTGGGIFNLEFSLDG